VKFILTGGDSHLALTVILVHPVLPPAWTALLTFKVHISVQLSAEVCEYTCYFFFFCYRSVLWRRMNSCCYPRSLYKLSPHESRQICWRCGPLGRYASHKVVFRQGTSNR